jgi:hypothetical protein
MAAQVLAMDLLFCFFRKLFFCCRSDSLSGKVARGNYLLAVGKLEPGLFERAEDSPGRLMTALAFEATAGLEHDGEPVRPVLAF